MKKYSTLLLLVTVSSLISCISDEYVEAESFEEIVKEIADEKNSILTKGKDCMVCNFDETTPEVIYCDNGPNEGGFNVVLQISQGTVVELVDITLTEQIEKASKSAICKFYTGE